MLLAPLLLAARLSSSALVGLKPLPTHAAGLRPAAASSQRSTRAAASGSGQPAAAAADAAAQPEQHTGFLPALVGSVRGQILKLDGLWDK